MGAFTVVVPEATAQKLSALADKLDRTSSSIAIDAIDEFIARETLNIADIEAGLAEADRGDFASDEDFATLLSKYHHTHASFF